MFLVVVPPRTPDYAEPELCLTVPKLGSTFRPAADEGYTVPLILTHYDVPGKLPEYAEPLPPEPEYATPFGDPPPAAADPPACYTHPASAPSVQYDCPAHKMAPNGYCMPGPVGGDPRRSSALYAEPHPSDAPPHPASAPPQTANAPSQHTYYEPL